MICVCLLSDFAGRADLDLTIQLALNKGHPLASAYQVLGLLV